MTTAAVNAYRRDALALVAMLLLVWEGAARSSLVPPQYLPPASQVLAAGAAALASGELLGHAATTLRAYVQGFALAALVGASLGLLMGLSPLARGALGTTVELLRPMPSVAIIPLAIVFFGLDDPMKRVVVAYAATWPVLLNTLYGVLHVESQLLDVARTFRLSTTATVWLVVLPAAAPYIATGLRIGSAVALILAVTVEMVASHSGLGRFVAEAQLSYRVPEMYAGLVAIGLLGYALHRLFVAVEARALAWHHRARPSPEA